MRLLFLVFCLFAIPSAFAAFPKILRPENGTKIQPGSYFDFEYQTVLQSGYISTNYTVMLFTKPPASAHPAEFWASGYIFGRYSIPNMGVLSLATGSHLDRALRKYQPSEPGANQVANAKDAVFWFVVIEEFQTDEGSLGYNFALATNYIIYNATDTGRSVELQ